MTASRSSPRTGSGTGSEIAVRPAATAVDSDQPKLTGRNDPARTAAPSAACPTVAPASRNGVLPYTLDTRIRIAAPARLTRTTSRIDWWSKPVTDQLVAPVSPGAATWADSHPPVQPTGDATAGAPAAPTTSAAATETPRRKCVLISISSSVS
ncbi:hypothetical protein [Fodinicola feengrottensis]|uniref:hypothetical protein n=1 Tax=Fodinicola feengrottensis TaxID=435914 RepID=UPI002441985D|nr:hypothetical protein [Fodinicola feengrottensis]